MGYSKNSKTVSVPTSPRTPFRIIEPLKILFENYQGKSWYKNKPLQVEFYDKLAEEDPTFTGGSSHNKDFSARDLIGRIPKTFGLVILEPIIKFTPLGIKFIEGTDQDRGWVLLNQMLKYQMPNPLDPILETRYSIKPYLEFMKLVIYHQGLSLEEIALFLIPLIHQDNIKSSSTKIANFKSDQATRDRNTESYSEWLEKVKLLVMTEVYAEEIHSGNFKTRESTTTKLEDFISKKYNNHRDHADALIRYFVATGFFYSKNRTVKVIERYEDTLRNFLCEIDTNLSEFDNIDAYSDFMGKEIILPVDMKSEIYSTTISAPVEIRNYDYKDAESVIMAIRAISESRRVSDAALLSEFLIWKALVILNDGDITGNFRMSATGDPIANAPGKVPDISCSYQDFELIVEVTTSYGDTQFKMEGDSVPRHFKKAKDLTTKDIYCLFLAPKVSEGTLDFFYSLTKHKSSAYREPKIIPMSFQAFLNIMTNANASTTKPSAGDLKSLLSDIINSIETQDSPEQWNTYITSSSEMWFK